MSKSPVIEVEQVNNIDPALGPPVAFLALTLNDDAGNMSGAC
jgi:hypothetical protein